MDRKQTILIADDSRLNRMYLMNILGDTYQYVEAETGTEALQMLREYPNIDLVLLDIVMPEMDGFGVLQSMVHYHWIEDIPVLVISSDRTDAFMERAYTLGAIDYIHRPYLPLAVQRRVENTLSLYKRQHQLTQLVSNQVLEFEKLASILLEVFGSTVESHNGENNQHILRVRTISEALLRRLVQKTNRYRLSESDITRIGMASALHDIGKSQIPSELLKKPGKLTAEEFEIVKTHTSAGAAILKELPAWQEEPLLQTAYEICRWHHERWDGGGYPDGLKGEAIPISAQAVSLADAYAALTAQRVYKPAFSPETAIQMIISGQCGAFNPLLLDCLLDISHQLAHNEALSEGARDDSQDSQRYSAELLDNEDFPIDPLPRQVLELERRKTAFYAAQCQGIQFEYEVPTEHIHMTNWLEPPENREFSFRRSNAASMQLLQPEDAQRLLDLYRNTTPDAPEFTMDAPLSVGMGTCMFRLTVRVLWSDGKQPKPLCILGQFSRLDDVKARRNFPALASTQDALSAKALLSELQRFFNLVRLVDPANARVLQLDSSGALVPAPMACHAIWEQNTRCRDCLSAKALSMKTRLCRLAFSESEIYHVISQYLEINGQPCVLELISKIDHGRWTELQGGRVLLELKQSSGGERDPLTGVYSRLYLEQELAGIEVDGVAILDADYFKSINDTYGHPTGDLALKAITRAISSCIRADDLLIRYGGDEFLILFPHIPETTFFERLEQIQKVVRAASVPDYPEVQLSVTVGGAYGVKDLSEAIRQADQKLYQGKARREPRTSAASAH